VKRNSRLFLPLLFSVLVIIANTTTGSTSTKDRVDCLYLLVLLDKVLDYAVRGDPVGELMSKYIVNAGVFGDLHDLHVSAYTAILDYYRVLHVTSETPFNLTSGAYRILEGLNDIGGYASRLSACSHDAEAAKALSVSVNAKLRGLRDLVYALIKVSYRARFTDAYQVRPLKDTYLPGEVVEIAIPREIRVETMEAYAWPSFLRIRDSLPRECNEVYCAYELSMPTAMELEHLGLRRYLIEQVLTVGIFAKLLNGSYLGVYLVTVKYDLPRVQVDMPSTVKRGDILEVKVLSEDFYNASLRLNGFEALNITFKPGTTVLALDPVHYNYTLGLNTLEICVNASIRTLSHCYSRVFTVEPVHPRVGISLGDFALTWSGFLTLTISNMDVVDVHAVVDTGVFKQTITVPGGCIGQVNIFTGILPVQGLNVNIGITATRGPYDELKVSRSIYVVNVAATIILTLVSVLLSSFMSSREKSFIVALITAWKRYMPVSVRHAELEVSRLLKPYKLGLGSHVALLYYELVRRLGIRMPQVHETLREHFMEISRSPSLTLTLKKLMWKMLLIAERDLYYSKRPPLEEARRLYEDVLNAARKE